ncbi:MAG: extracellular solute-binding protein [Promicromonosporaceae bacterium]|nr:extracellular solute-binding protein [Promicromonosporaceae bacterium]
MKLRKYLAVGAAVAMAFTFAACGNGDDNGGDSPPPPPVNGGDPDGGGETVPLPGGDFAGTVLEYWMWDDRQRPMYEACAEVFTEQTGIEINTTATAWGQYWDNLSTNIAAGTGPDVFVLQIGFMNQFASTGQLADLAPLGVVDAVDWDAFIPGLAESFGMHEGVVVGTPKDWDTQGLVYNVEMATAAGWTEEEINNLTFNAQDGGTFAEFIKSITLDANGNNALSPDFDSNNVVTHGFLPDWSDGASGQNGWGNLAHALGYTHQNADGSHNFASQEMIDVLTWYREMMDLGVAPMFDATSTVGTQAMMESGFVASTFAGSWMAMPYMGPEQAVDFNFARVPEGPAGRFAATNGLVDVIWTGSNNQEAAALWVTFLASPECQVIVGDFGEIFPAVSVGTDAAVAARAAHGLDSTPFTSVAEAGETYMIPALVRAGQTNQVVVDALQAIASGADIISTLEGANAQIEALETP